MEDAAAEDGAPMHVRTRHIKKRALKNKTVSVSFNEKDLRDFVTGFHKRKKKRRKVARQQQEEAYRRKRIELRKQRKLERDYVMSGGAAPSSGTEGAESIEENEDEDTEPVVSVSGTKMYDNGDLQVTVTTSEIVPEDEHLINQPEPGKVQVDEALEEKRKQRIPVIKKKQFKKTPRKRSRAKQQTKREKRKGNDKNKHQF